MVADSLIIVGVENAYNTSAYSPGDSYNTYSDCGAGTAQFSYPSHTGVIQLFYTQNQYNVSSLSITAGAQGDYSYLFAVEYTGYLSSGGVDKYAKSSLASTGTGGGQNMTVGPITPTTNGDLLVGFYGNAYGANAGTGWTGLLGGGTNLGGFEAFIQSTASSVSATWNCGSNNVTYGAIIAAFKVAPPTPAPRLIWV